MRNRSTGLGFFLVFTLAAWSAAGAQSADAARVEAATWSYVVFAASVTLVKIVALVVGYLVVRLGYTTMMAGVQGKDAVDLKLPGARFSFKGVTPGLALGVVGVLMMIWALSTKHHFTTEASSTSGTIEHSEAAAGRAGTDNAPVRRPDVEKAPKF